MRQVDLKLKQWTVSCCTVHSYRGAAGCGQSSVELRKCQLCVNSANATKKLDLFTETALEPIFYTSAERPAPFENTSIIQSNKLERARKRLQTKLREEG